MVMKHSPLCSQHCRTAYVSRWVVLYIANTAERTNERTPTPTPKQNDEQKNYVPLWKGTKYKAHSKFNIKRCLYFRSEWCPGEPRTNKKKGEHARKTNKKHTHAHTQTHSPYAGGGSWLRVALHREACTHMEGEGRETGRKRGGREGGREGAGGTHVMHLRSRMNHRPSHPYKIPQIHALLARWRNGVGVWYVSIVVLTAVVLGYRVRKSRQQYI